MSSIKILVLPYQYIELNSSWAIIVDMQKSGNSRTVIAYHLFSILLIAASFVMYYAAGMVLNTLYAGIGAAFAAVLGIAVGIGAVLAVLLFGHIRSSIHEEYTDDETALYNTDLLIRDIVSGVTVTLLCGTGGIVLWAGAVCSWLIRRYLQKYRMFGMIPLFMGIVISAVLSIRALTAGRAGLYGVIMFCLISMDLIHHHRIADQEHQSSVLNLALLCVGKICSSVLFGLIVSETARVLRYRIMMSQTGNYELMAVTGLAAALCFGIGSKKEADQKAERVSSLITAFFVLVMCVRINPYCSLAAGSGMAAVILLPMIGERDEEETLRDVLRFVFLTVVCAAGWLLYWSGMAAFDEILYTVILYMSVCMNTGTFIKEKEDIDDGELERAEDTPDHLADHDQCDEPLDVRD